MYDAKVFHWIIYSSGNPVRSTTEVEIDNDGEIGMHVIERKDQEKQDSEKKKESGERYRPNSDVPMM